MANTNFSTLYSMIRSACGDYGIVKNDSPTDYIYRDDIIDGALQVILLSLSDYSDGGSNAITPAIEGDSDKALIIYSVALFLLVKETESIFQTRDERFQKSTPYNQLLYVARQLSKIEGVDFLVGVNDGSSAAIINAGIRWANNLSGITE